MTAGAVLFHDCDTPLSLSVSTDVPHFREFFCCRPYPFFFDAAAATSGGKRVLIDSHPWLPALLLASSSLLLLWYGRQRFVASWLFRPVHRLAPPPQCRLAFS